MSGRRDREARREARLREDEQAGVAERRQRLIKIGSAAAFLALIVIAVAVVVSQTQTSGGDPDNLTGASEVNRELSGIPQNGMVLGKPGAKAKLLEFGDLQCPVCKGFSEEVLPEVIESQARTSKARIEFRNFTIIGPQSTPAGAAAIAAGEQGRGWNFVELFYRNQGTEDSGYATGEFLTAVAKAAGVPDIARWNSERKSKRVLGEVAASTAEAERLGFTGTPSFAIQGPGASGTEALGLVDSAGDLESAIEAAAGR